MTYTEDGNEEFSPSDIIALVNGEVIPRQEFEIRINQTQTAYQDQGANIDDDEVRRSIEDHVLEAMIGELLLEQEAEQADMPVSEDDIEEGYNQVRAEFDNDDVALIDALFAQGMTREDLRKEIADRLRIQQYIENSIDPEDIQLSEDDIYAVYKNYTAEMKDAPPFEEVQDELVSQLEETRLQQAVIVLIDKLRKVSEIEVFLE
ncbi:MAG: SurA N-terminal domain-containing protein [bacterium]